MKKFLFVIVSLIFSGYWAFSQTKITITDAKDVAHDFFVSNPADVLLTKDSLYLTSNEFDTTFFIRDIRNVSFAVPSEKKQLEGKMADAMSLYSNALLDNYPKSAIESMVTVINASANVLLTENVALEDIEKMQNTLNDECNTFRSMEIDKPKFDRNDLSMLYDEIQQFWMDTEKSPEWNKYPEDCRKQLQVQVNETKNILSKDNVPSSEIETMYDNLKKSYTDLLQSKDYTLTISEDVAFTFGPNPCTDWFSIETADEISSVDFYNLLGKKVLSETSTSMYIGNLVDGVYCVVVRFSNGKTKTISILKK